MSDPSRFIEVLAKARLTRAVESFRAEINLTVTTKRSGECLEQALKLRDEVLLALEKAGLERTAIQESNGALEQSIWSSSKQVTHSLFVVHADMSVLVRAMAQVESVLASRKQSFWSATKHNFKFGALQPQYAADPDAIHRSLEQAILTAEKQASAMASQARLQLAGVKSITQLLPTEQPRRVPVSGDNFDLMDDDSDFFQRPRVAMDHGSHRFTALAPKQDSGTNWYCVRFFVTDIQ